MVWPGVPACLGARGSREAGGLRDVCVCVCASVLCERRLCVCVLGDSSLRRGIVNALLGFGNPRWGRELSGLADGKSEGKKMCYSPKEEHGTWVNASETAQKHGQFLSVRACAHTYGRIRAPFGAERW